MRALPGAISASSRLRGEVRSSGFSLLRAQGSLKAEIQTWDKWVRGLSCFLVAAQLLCEFPWPRWSWEKM